MRFVWKAFGSFPVLLFFEGGCGVGRVLVNIYIDYPNARLCSSKEVSFKIRVAEGADKS